MLFRESTNKAMLTSLLGRETNFENPYSGKISESQVATMRKRENYLDEDFMDTLIDKIKKKDKQLVPQKAAG